MYIINNFTFNTSPIRVVDIDGNPWFLGLDIPNTLGFTQDNLKFHLKMNLGADEKQVAKLPGFRGNGVTLISESGMYKLVMRSNKPEAKGFQGWVTKVVLPAIRKDGMYVMGEEKIATGGMTEEEMILKVVTTLQRKVDRMAEEKAIAEAKVIDMAMDKAIAEARVVEMAPKASAWEATIDNEGTTTTQVLAAQLGYSDPTDIRELIKRYEEPLSALGISRTVRENTGKRGRPGTAYYLNKKQSLFIIAKSETDTAIDMTIKVIEKFMMVFQSCRSKCTNKRRRST